MPRHTKQTLYRLGAHRCRPAYGGDSTTAAVHTRAAAITLHYRASRSISHKTARPAAGVDRGSEASSRCVLFRVSCIRQPVRNDTQSAKPSNITMANFKQTAGVH